MSALTNFPSLPDPIIFNQNLRNPSPNLCSKSSPPNIFSRLIVGVVVKDIALIPIIALHIVAGMGKLALCTTKITYSIPARLWGRIPNYQKTGKEGLVHLGFSGFHFADIFISITNIINQYPQDLAKKVDGFLQILKTNSVDKLERKTCFADLVSLEHQKYLKKTTPKAAEDLANLYAENHSILFDVLYAEYLKNNEGQKKIELKAKIYVENYIRIYSLLCAKISKKNLKEEALLHAKIYVHAYAKEFTKQLKKNTKEEREKQADAYAKWFTKFFFVEYPNYLKNNTETAKEKAITYAEKHVSIFFNVCSVLVKKHTKEDERKLTILFEVYLQNSPQIKNEINTVPSFKTYAHKYLECLTDDRKKNAKKIAERSFHYFLHNQV